MGYTDLMWQRVAPYQGIVFVCSAVAIFAIQNMLTKLMSDSFATHQIMFVRAFFMIPVVIIVALITKEVATLGTKYPVMHLLRSLSLFFAFSGFFLGISALPLANSVAIFFSAPLFVTLFSALILREHVGIHRIAAVIVGFIGVLVIVRPGLGDFNYATLFPLCGAISYAFMPIITRSFSNTESASCMIFYNALFSIALAGLVGAILGFGQFTTGVLGDPLYFLTRAWELPTGWLEWGFFALIGTTSAVGSYFAAQAYRTTKASTITPFEYTSLLWATFWGFIIWGDVPETLTLLGMTLIVSAGIYIVFREAYRNRSADIKTVGNG